MTPSDALLQIQELMDGVEWTPDTLDEIARVMRRADYRIRDLDDADIPNLRNFRVEWSIDVDAASPEEAAAEALKILRDPCAEAFAFEVTPTDEQTSPVFVDLLAEEGDVDPKPDEPEPVNQTMGMYVVVAGNINASFRVYGPFKTGAHAAGWANSYSPSRFWVMPLLPTEPEP